MRPTEVVDGLSEGLLELDRGVAEPLQVGTDRAEQHAVNDSAVPLHVHALGVAPELMAVRGLPQAGSGP